MTTNSQPLPSEEGETPAFDSQNTAPPSAEMIVQGLQEQLAARDAELTETKDRVVRALAETENVRRRLEKEKADANIYALRSFSRDLLTVADNLRRALESMPAEARENAALANVISGVEMTERELLHVFGRYGIEQVQSLGKKLDPNLHQAMAEAEVAGAEPGTIHQVFQQGYTIKGQLLRPAMVIVAKAPADSTAAPRVDTSA